MSKLTGKVAVVTGASKGIGAGIAKELSAAGAKVVVNYASSRAAADQVVAEIKEQGGQAIAVQGDMSVADDVKRLFAETKEAFGALDVLVNNAAVFKFEPLEQFREAEFHRQFNTNVLGPILAIKEAVAHFGEKGGSIINISSIASQSPNPGSLVYAATKSALDSITRLLSRELGPRNIRVNSVNPGPTVTEGVVEAGFIGSSEEHRMVSETPLGRIGQPKDIGQAVVFLASDAAGWLTGEAIRVAGGLH